MLYSRGRINNYAGISSSAYLNDILTAMSITVLPITSEIAEISQSSIFVHGDPADRIIAATTLAHRTQLITADEKLRSTPGLQCIW
ncbi:PIN domain-containing protein [Methylomonas sp. AM2-LC]|uniref:PIN domain-containing protein n=1 Tax=Methylomonas sp. AM2-LC TaxID=3153301 RepID=UPI0032652EC9